LNLHYNILVHLAPVGQMANAYKLLVGKPEGKR